MKNIMLGILLMILGSSTVHGKEFLPAQKPVSLDEIDALRSIETIKFSLNNEAPIIGEIVVWQKLGGETSVIHRQFSIPLSELTFTVIEHPRSLDGPKDSNERVIRTRVGGVPPEESTGGWSAMGGEARPYQRLWERGVSHQHLGKLKLGRNIIYIQGLDDGTSVFGDEGSVDLDGAWEDLANGMMIEILLTKDTE